MIDRRAPSLFTPTHGITLEALNLLFVPLGGGWETKTIEYHGVGARVNGTKTIEFRFRRV